MVGARLLYPSGRLQHAGVVYLPRTRRFDHEYRHRPGNYPPALETTEVLGVTGALMLVEKGFWDKLGGMDEQFFLSWEDVDFPCGPGLPGGGCSIPVKPMRFTPRERPGRTGRRLPGLSGTRWTGRPKPGSGGNGAGFSPLAGPIPKPAGRSVSAGCSRPTGARYSGRRSKENRVKPRAASKTKRKRGGSMMRILLSGADPGDP